MFLNSQQAYLFLSTYLQFVLRSNIKQLKREPSKNKLNQYLQLSDKISSYLDGNNRTNGNAAAPYTQFSRRSGKKLNVFHNFLTNNKISIEGG